MRMRALRFGVGAIRALHYTTWQTDLITSDSLALSHRRVASERNKVYDAVSSENLRASVRWINPSVRPSLPPGLRYSHLSLLSSPPPGRVSPRDWREKSAAAAVWRSPSVFRVSWSACACFSHTNTKHTPPRAPVQVRHACVRVETQREARARTHALLQQRHRERNNVLPLDMCNENKIMKAKTHKCNRGVFNNITEHRFSNAAVR